ncbi:MAG: GH3 auxin-responsive promoter family protein [Candidatus Synoicihabitans palmerolidicus]|nr:GH3 auxin-responsive promoter family protein [Candidatus Synoicihabitans palmerolidicus]
MHADYTKAFLTFTVQWHSARTRRQLRRASTAHSAQPRILASLLPQLAATKRYREFQLDPRMSPADFRHQVPLSLPTDNAPWVERMVASEPNVLWPGRCQNFATTAGSTTGHPQIIPVTEAMQDHFMRATRACFLHATARAKHVEALRGRLLLIGGNTLQPGARIPSPDNPDAPVTADIASLAMLLRPDWVARHYLEPTAKIALQTNWHAMVKRIRHRDITALAGNPHWLTEFSRTVLEKLSHGKLRYTNLRAVWPYLNCVFHTGAAPESYTTELRRLLGEGVMLHDVYTAAERIYAAQGLGQSTGLRLLYNVGIYFEFIPLVDFAHARIDDLSTQALSLDAIEVGQNYVLVITTPAGLVRHIPGDIVRIVSTAPPRIRPVGQISTQLNLFNENLHAGDLSNILSELCRNRRWHLSYFHVAPLPFASDLGRIRGCHEWWVELRPGTRETPTGPNLAAELDRRLRRDQPAYAASRENGTLGAPIVRLVMPGAFEHWLKYSHQWGGPHKLLACRNDRRIIDSLAQMARFSKD